MVNNLDSFVIENNVVRKYKSTNPICIIPEGVKKIGSHAIENSDIFCIIFPSSLEEIDDEAVINCHRLREIFINHDFKVFGQSPFINCEKLNLVHYDGSSGEYNQILKGEPFGTDKKIIFNK